MFEWQTTGPDIHIGEVAINVHPTAVRDCADVLFSRASSPESFIGNVVIIRFDNHVCAARDGDQIADVLASIMPDGAQLGESQTQLALLSQTIETAAFQLKYFRARLIADNN